MGSGFSYGDIIVIGAIAAFILLRYRSMLGESGDRDGSRPSSLSDFERVIQLPPIKTNSIPTVKTTDTLAAYGALSETLAAVVAIDHEFTPEEFLQGARNAYEMVIEAFSKRNRDTLKMLLSEAMYQSFDLSLADAEKTNRFPDTTLIAITSAVLVDAKLSGKMATLTVDFKTEQVHLIRDAAGTILEGNPAEQSFVEDRWVFTRTLTNTDPAWVIVET